MNKAIATLSHLNISHYKLNRIASLIRGMSVKDAKLQLMFSVKKGSRELFKLMMSCVANAENKYGVGEDVLFIEKIDIGKAFVLRRFMPRGRGRSTRIEKRFSMARMVLSDSALPKSIKSKN